MVLAALSAEWPAHVPQRGEGFERSLGYIQITVMHTRSFQKTERKSNDIYVSGEITFLCFALHRCLKTGWWISEQRACNISVLNAGIQWWGVVMLVGDSIHVMWTV